MSTKRVVWKFALPEHGSGIVPMPKGAQILSWGHQPHAGLQVWALVDPDAPKVGRRLFVLGTGHVVDFGDVELPMTFVGTLQSPGGLVFHLWDCGESAVGPEDHDGA